MIALMLVLVFKLFDATDRQTKIYINKKAAIYIIQTNAMTGIKARLCGGIDLLCF